VEPNGRQQGRRSEPRLSRSSAATPRLAFPRLYAASAGGGLALIALQGPLLPGARAKKAGRRQTTLTGSRDPFLRIMAALLLLTGAVMLFMEPSAFALIN
jgi:hypothetical protein